MGSDGLESLADAVLLPAVAGTVLPDDARRRLERGLGGITLFAPNVHHDAQVAALVGQVHDASPHAVVALDEEGGDVTRLERHDGSSYPGNLALGAAGDPTLTRDVADALGGDVARAGADLCLGPCADVLSVSDSPAVGTRSFGEDPAAVAAHTAAWVEGVQGRGVAACAKHFPGHGGTTVDSHLSLPVLTAPEVVWRERDLPPFAAAVSAGVRAVMTGHLVLRALDDEPATVSARLTRLLRDELGFEGAVLTDALDMRAVRDRYGVGEAAVRAVLAGADGLVLGAVTGPGAVTDEARDALVAAVREGRLRAERLEEGAGRLQALARWSAAHRRPSPRPDPGLGLVAARRALVVRGDVRLTAAPLVVELVSPSGIAAGEQTPWGLGASLQRLLPGTSAVRVAAAGDEASRQGLLAALALAHRLPLVLVTREAHRLPAQAALRDLALARRPDAVVVELGAPAPGLPRHRREVLAFGGSRACAAAAAEVLAGRPAG